MNTLHNNYCNSKQGYLPLFLSDCLDLLDPVLTFDRLMGGIDLNKYLTEIEEMNAEIAWSGVQITTNPEYVPDYLNEIVEQLVLLWELDTSTFVYGSTSSGLLRTFTHAALFSNFSGFSDTNCLFSRSQTSACIISSESSTPNSRAIALITPER